MLPKVDTSAVDKSFETAIEHMKTAIELGRVGREHKEIALKQPLREATIIHREQSVIDALQSLESYVQTELNVRQSKVFKGRVSVRFAEGRCRWKGTGKDTR